MPNLLDQRSSEVEELKQKIKNMNIQTSEAEALLRHLAKEKKSLSKDVECLEKRIQHMNWMLKLQLLLEKTNFTFSATARVRTHVRLENPTFRMSVTKHLCEIEFCFHREERVPKQFKILRTYLWDPKEPLDIRAANGGVLGQHAEEKRRWNAESWAEPRVWGEVNALLYAGPITLTRLLLAYCERDLSLLDSKVSPANKEKPVAEAEKVLENFKCSVLDLPENYRLFLERANGSGLCEKVDEDLFKDYELLRLQSAALEKLAPPRISRM